MRIPQFDLTAQNANTPLLLANLGNTFFSGLEQGQKRRLQGERQRTLADLGRDLESGNDPNFKGAAARLMGLGDMEGALGFLKLGEAAQRRADERGATEGFNRLLGGQASTSPAGSASVTAADPNEVQTRFMSGIRQAGVTNPYGLAAIAATGQRESGFSPGNVNRSWSDPSERGQPGMSGGVMSWRGPRLQALQAFAQQRGEQGMGSPETQAAFLAQEDPTLIPRLNQARSAQEAAQIMASAWRFAGYNRPGGEAAARASLAAQYADRFKGGEQPQTAQAPQPPRRPPNLGPVQVAETEEDVQRMEAQMGAQPVQMAQAPVQADVPVGGEAQGFAVPGAPQQARPSLPPGDPIPQASNQQIMQMMANPNLGDARRSVLKSILDRRLAFEGSRNPLDEEYRRTQIARNQRELNTRFEPLVTPEDRRAAGIPENDPRPYQINRATGEIKAVGGNNVTVNNQQERAYDQTRGKADAERFNELQTQGRSAGQTMNTLRIMEGLAKNPNFYSGFGGQTALQANRILGQLGIKDANAASPAEVFQSLSNRVVLDGLGGSLGTAISNADREFIQQTAPNLANTREGNLAMIELGKAMASRQQQVARMAREYASKNGGRLDSGFDDQMAAWSQENPLVTPELMERVNKAAGAGAQQGQAPLTPGQSRTIDGVTIRRVQ